MYMYLLIGMNVKQHSWHIFSLLGIIELGTTLWACISLRGMKVEYLIKKEWVEGNSSSPGTGDEYSQYFSQKSWTLKADSHIACCAFAVPMPCRAAKGLECIFPIWFTQCGRVWFTLAMPRPCHALTMPFFSRPRHSTAVERRPVAYLPTFGFFRLPRGVPRRLLSEAYQSSTQRSVPTTVKSGSSILQKLPTFKLLD
jgi:hypothetical protein